jgi:hypothetical protein
MSPATFTAMIAVGPDPVELVRLRDLLTSLVHFEPTVSRILLIDDSTEARDLSASVPPLPATCRLEILPSERRGRGRALMGGGCLVMLTGLREAHRGGVGAFVLKFDTDALVVAPFSQKLIGVIAREPDAGIIGACALSPTGKPRGDEYFRRVFGNFTRWRLPASERKLAGRMRSFPTRLVHVKLLRLTRRARKTGCTLGENVQGGAYAITAKAIDRMASAGYLDDVTVWLDTFALEDGVLPLYARMLGLKLVDYVGHHEVFGVVYRGLPASLDDIVERGYSIVHSIKNDERATEEQVRDYFARRRQTG